MLTAFQRPGYGLLFILLLLASSLLQAHKLSPSIIDVTFGEERDFSIGMEVNLEAVLAGIGPEHEETSASPRAGEYDRLRQMPPAELEAVFRAFLPRFLDGVELVFDDRRTGLAFEGVSIPEVGDTRLVRRSHLRFSGLYPADAASFRLAFGRAFGNAVLRIHAPELQEAVTHWLTDGRMSPAFAVERPQAALSTGETITQYTMLGFTHILPLGLDHILFVLGLFLLSIHLRPVLWQVTAFTLAHTITLALTILGYIALPDSIVEPLIAASIVYIGLENILTQEIHWHRVIVIFLFGLLHGMGFAGVLHELGLPEGQLATALISFNVGVELGQIAVILLAFLAIGVWFRNKPWYRRFVVIPFSLLIALVGFYWFIERLA
ncbi:MAG: HupE/UreJ family protein [Gammaproteobacteria bacterium]|jgi:hydrogenase/urease accessory protein HupE